MGVLEKWGHRADALVACLMAGCALAVAIYGVNHTCKSDAVLPYLLLFFSLELLWFGWIFHSLLLRAHRGYFTPAAWHVAIALPIASLSLLSLFVWAPNKQAMLHSPMVSDRLLEHILLSVQYWFRQC